MPECTETDILLVIIIAGGVPVVEVVITNWFPITDVDQLAILPPFPSTSVWRRPPWIDTADM